jgi:hypothetical protein
MSQPSRRARAECDPVFLVLIRLVTRLSLNDLSVAGAIDKADGLVDDAARLLKIPSTAMRQRVLGLRQKFESAIPGLHFSRGRVAREVSFDQTDGFSDALGVD